MLALVEVSLDGTPLVLPTSRDSRVFCSGFLVDFLLELSYNVVHSVFVIINKKLTGAAEIELGLAILFSLDIVLIERRIGINLHVYNELIALLVEFFFKLDGKVGELI